MGTDDLISGKIYVGSGEGTIELDLDKIKAEKSFWLRTNLLEGSSPATDKALFLICANSENNYTINSVKLKEVKSNLAPAFNLDLSSFLFASAAPAAADDASLPTETNPIMTMRFDSAKKADGTSCDDRIISSAKANAEGIEITNPTEGEYLYVQWSEGDTDEVKSFALTESKNKITAVDVFGKTGTKLNENCKIWLEKTENNITYAKTTVFIKTASCTAPEGVSGLVYDGETHDLVSAAKDVSGGVVKYAVGTENEATGSWTDEIPNGKNAGDYYVWYKVVVTDTEKYEDSTPKKVNKISIGQKTITVTPNANQSKTEGSSDPAFTYTVDGAVSGETAAFSGVLSRAAGEQVSEQGYAITKGTLALKDNGDFKASNYTLQLDETTVYFKITEKSQDDDSGSFLRKLFKGFFSYRLFKIFTVGSFITGILDKIKNGIVITKL